MQCQVSLVDVAGSLSKALPITAGSAKRSAIWCRPDGRQNLSERPIPDAFHQLLIHFSSPVFIILKIVSICCREMQVVMQSIKFSVLNLVVPKYCSYSCIQVFQMPYNVHVIYVEDLCNVSCHVTCIIFN